MQTVFETKLNDWALQLNSKMTEVGEKDFAAHINWFLSSYPICSSASQSELYCCDWCGAVNQVLETPFQVDSYSSSVQVFEGKVAIRHPRLKRNFRLHCAVRGCLYITLSSEGEGASQI